MFNVWNQTFTDGDSGKAALFHSFFSSCPRHRSAPILQGETLQPTVLFAHCPGLTGHLSISLWLKHATSIATPVYLRISANGTYRVIMQPYASSFKKPTIRSNQGKRIPSWRSEHPVFCSILNQISDDHQYAKDPFGALADLKSHS